MASSIFIISSLMLLILVNTTSTTGRLLGPSSEPIMRFQYHNGPLLAGNLTVNLIWYGPFTPAQRAIVSDFISSLCGPRPTGAATPSSPSVSSWWASVSKYHRLASPTRPVRLSVKLGSQLLDDKYSVGKSLSADQLRSLAANGQSAGSISVVLTGSDVAVDGFCMNRCGTHGSGPSGRAGRATYIWVGDSVTQCPGLCAWPFHQPIYGPQGPPLVSPNGDVGMDGMVMNLAGLLAGTVTNPFGNGYFQGPKDAPLEAASACPGVYGKGAYPGYAGELLVDSTSGASYNANGINGRKYLLPALFDPATQTCSTLV